MKISKLFHYLYASLMFMPLAVIPIFGIYCRNENSTFSQSITTSGYEVKNKYETNEVQYPDDMLLNHIYYTDTLWFIENADGYDFGVHILKFSSWGQDMLSIHDWEWELGNYDANVNNYLDVYVHNNEVALELTNQNAKVDMYALTGGQVSLYFNECYFVPFYGLNDFIAHCEDYATDDFYPSYDFNILEYVWNDGIVLDDTDVGSQLVYTIYNTMEKYFNFSKMFGLDGIETWVNQNILGGNFIVGFTIFWDLLCYWLFVSIFWLIFDLLMYVPNLAHKWLDKAAID